MTKLGRSITIGCLFLAALVLAANSRAQERPSIAEQIAKTYGLDSFEKIEAIRYTFKLQFPGVNVSRTWVWQTKTGQVTYEAKDKDGKPVKITYVRTQLDGEPANVKDEIEPAFVNDEYNLLFPFHVYWDGADVQDKGMQKMPIGKGTARLVEVKYGSDGGYSPGDTWDLYVGPDNRVKAFAFHRGGAKKPTDVVATWAGYKKAGPLLVSTDRRGTADGQPLQFALSDVSVKLAGSDVWVKAK